MLFCTFTLCFLILGLAPKAFGSQDTLREFATDACTFFIEGTLSQPNLWGSCCFEHDLRYWFGGTKKQRNHADYHLYKCVREQANEKWARFIYWGVRAGSYSPVKSKYAWGWGFRDYKQKANLYDPLTHSRRKIVIDAIENMELTGDFKRNFLIKYLGY